MFFCGLWSISLLVRSLCNNWCSERDDLIQPGPMFLELRWSLCTEIINWLVVRLCNQHTIFFTTTTTTVIKIHKLFKLIRPSPWIYLHVQHFTFSSSSSPTSLPYSRKYVTNDGVSTRIVHFHFNYNYPHRLTVY